MKCVFDQNLWEILIASIYMYDIQDDVGPLRFPAVDPLWCVVSRSYAIHDYALLNMCFC